MTSINSSLANSYFSLNNSSTSTTSAQQQLAPAPSLANLLASAYAANPANNDSSGGNSFLLDLSDSAKSYMAGLSTTPTASSSTASTQYALTNKQQDTLASIVNKYKDAPYTQATFDQMQDDLKAAGLGTDQLTGDEAVRNVNPTAMLLSALNGTTDTSVIPDGGVANAQTKATNFMQQVIAMWKSISTTAATTPDPTAAAAAAAATSDAVASS